MGLGFSLQGLPQPGVLFQTLHLCCNAPCLMLTDLQVCDATASSRSQIKNPFFSGPPTDTEATVKSASRRPDDSHRS